MNFVTSSWWYIADTLKHRCMHACRLSHFSHVWLFATPWTAAHQALLFTGFSRQEYSSGLPFPSLAKHTGSPTFPFVECTLLLFGHSAVSDSVTSWSIAPQAPLSKGISRWEHWSRLPFPSPWDLPNPGIEPASPSSLLQCRQVLYHWATGEAGSIMNLLWPWTSHLTSLALDQSHL